MPSMHSIGRCDERTRKDNALMALLFLRIEIMPRIPSKQNKNTEAYWDDVYSQEIERGEFRYYPQRFEPVALSCAGHESGAFFDFAAGTGEFASYIRDMYPKMKITAYERSYSASICGVNRHRRVSFLYAPPNPTIRKFDIVHCGQTLEHLDDPADLLKYLWSICADRGKVIVTVPFEDQIIDDEHVWQFSENELLSLLRTHSDKIEVRRLESDPRYMIGIVEK